MWIVSNLQAFLATLTVGMIGGFFLGARAAQAPLAFHIVALLAVALALAARRTNR
jgi:hypothetical protein